MIVLVGMPCEAETTRSKLRHDWLVNEVRTRGASVVARAHGKTSSPARADFEESLLPNGDYDQQLRRLRGLVETMIDGYSPAQLVERGPLVQFSEPAQNEIKKVLHEQYLRISLHEEDGIEELQAKLHDATEKFSRALDGFREVWFHEPPVSEDEVETAFRKVRSKASDLIDTLNQLPRGIVLP